MAAKQNFITVFVQGKKILLSESHYMTEGGEGRLYRDKGTIFKIYHDPNKMIPEAKVRELGVLKHQFIVIPSNLIYDDKNRIIGFTMNQVDASEMCRLFNTIYLNDNNIGNEKLVKLVENIQGGVEFIHTKDCLIVDGNEMNYLVSNTDCTHPYFIDTNAYATPSFRADAYTEAFTDPQCNLNFDRQADWYSFGIVACKIFTGIHPYKGTHPNYTKKELLKRMKDRMSIFNDAVALPTAARDFSFIPSEYFKWFIELFEEGKRVPPPSVGGLLNVTIVKKQLTQVVAGLTVERVMQISTDIKRIFTFRGKIAAVGKDDDKIVLFSPKTEREVNIRIENDCLKATDPNTTVPAMRVEKFFVKDNVLYIVGNGLITPMKVNEIGSKCILSVGTAWNIPRQSSKVYDGVVTAVMFGKNYAFIPVTKGNIDICAIQYIPEIDNKKVVYARCEKNVLVVVVSHNNQYDRLIIRFNDKFDAYTVRTDEDIDYPYINFTVLDKGVCVMMNENAELELFHADMNSAAVKKLTGGKDLANTMILFTDGLNVMYYEKNKIFKISMK